jgi:hypothetical protein
MALPPRLLLPGDVVYEITNHTTPLTVEAIQKQADLILLIDEKGLPVSASAAYLRQYICLDDYVCWQHEDGKASCGWVNNIWSDIAQIAPLLKHDDISHELVLHFLVHIILKLICF